MAAVPRHRLTWKARAAAAGLLVAICAAGAFASGGARRDDVRRDDVRRDDVRRADLQVRQRGDQAVHPSQAPSGTAPQRIISLVPSTTEMLFAFGAGTRVVAVGTYDHFPPEVERLPRVGALLDPDIERILSLRPDLVVLYGTQTDLIATLQRARIPFFAYEHHGVADITQTIRALGARVGSSREADSLADGIDRQLAAIRSRTAPLNHPRTLLVFGRQPGSLRNIDASGGDGFLHDMLEIAGGTDVLADIHRQSVTMSTEMVLARAPAVIIEVHSPSGGFTAASDLTPWNALSSIPAVRNHRVYSLVGDEFVIPGPRVVQGVTELEKTLDGAR